MKIGKCYIPLRKPVLRLLRIALIIYVAMFCLQRQLLFPSYLANTMLGPLKTPEQYQLKDFQEVNLETSDHVHIMGWLHNPQPGMPIILYFHGNGTHLGGDRQRYNDFAKAGYGVLALSYRGYGKSGGSPSEEGLYCDGRAAIAYLGQHYTSPKIILYGESLGSGVAIEMAKETPVYGVVLQGAYTSVAAVAAQVYWYLPGTFYLVRDRFDSLSKISSIQSPILMLHGDQDTVIPLSLSKELFAAGTSRKKLIVVEGAGHMNIPSETIIHAVNDFFLHKE